MKLLKDSTVRTSLAASPLPVINTEAKDVDFFEGIVSKLKWNQSFV
jgi:hypothetical protein